MKLVMDDGKEIFIDSMKTITVDKDETLIVAMKGNVKPMDLYDVQDFFQKALKTDRVIVIDETVDTLTKVKIN